MSHFTFAAPAIRLAIVAAIVGASALAPFAAFAAGPAPAPDPGPKATPLTAFELLRLFGNKSWNWADGAGYFGTDAARSFVAYAGDTKASGHWTITDRGRMCMSAVWKSADSAVPAVTCFLHVEANGDIYQRKLPDGAWYIFKHATPDQTDEASKLVGGNQVSAHLS